MDLTLPTIGTGPNSGTGTPLPDAIGLYNAALLLIQDALNNNGGVSPDSNLRLASLLMGHTALVPIREGTSTITPQSQRLGISDGDSRALLGRWDVGALAPGLNFHKSRGAIGAHGIISSGDRLMSISASGSDGAKAVEGARIVAQTSGATGVTIMPTALKFFLNDGSGTSTPTERFRLNHNGEVSGGSDNSQTLGTAALRWSVVYAGTGAINTSDERTKTGIVPISDQLLDAWASVEWASYRFIDAVERKGNGARVHYGLVAQRVKAALDGAGLEAEAHALLCRDAWEAEYETDEAAEVQPMLADGTWTEEKSLRLVRAAGDRWGLRYEECLAVEAAYQRRRAERMEARLSAIEARLGV